MATDLTGKTFGHLTVLEIDSNKSPQNKITAKTYWLCQCDCSNHTIKSIRGDHLARNEIISCGCEKKGKTGRKAIDLVGERFGRLEVLERAPGRGTSDSAFWKCKCDCGNIVTVSSSSLKQGDTKSCGCLKHDVLSQLYTQIGKSNISNLVGKKFGHLTVLRDSGERMQGAVIWECLCDCGNSKPIYVSTGNLTSGHTQSCGCIGASLNEKRIEKMLQDEGIPFITQASMQLNNSCYYFDFMVDNTYVIEFDGIQHFSYRENKGWNNAENFAATRKRDMLKNEYCFSNGIPLIRIPYNETYELKDLRLETTRFLLTRENQEAYYDRT